MNGFTLTVKTPEKYINKLGLLSEAGSYALELGTKALFIAGRTAFSKVDEAGLLKSLASSGVQIVFKDEFSGFPSNRQFELYAKKIRETKADFVIAAGGGRVLDTAKAAADIAGVRVVTVPTVAATCASWAALSIEYDDSGAFVRVRENKKCPAIILVDPAVILSSPVRFTLSGIVDTFAKFYEVRPTLSKFPTDEATDISFHASELALNNIRAYSDEAFKSAEQGVYGEAAAHIIDAIFYLAGFAGSFTSGSGHYSFAHPFYHTSTKLLHTNVLLHGEKVAFGIVTQLILEGRPDSDVIETIELFARYKNDFTFDDLKINAEQDLEFLAKQIPLDFPYVPYQKDEIIAALKKADLLTRQQKSARTKNL